MLKSKKIYLIPVFGFLAIIVIFALLLKAPISNYSKISNIDALFESASAVTATGSTVVNISEQFTFIGQFIMLLAMQIGAIGFMLFFSFIFMLSKQKLRLSDSIFLGNEINTTNYTVVKQKVKRITRYTLAIEFFGAWLLAFRLIPMYGVKDGLWYSLFHSVSAFCNVGADVIGSNSLADFSGDVYVNLIFIVLMFLGSLGYFVLEDLITFYCTGKKNKIHIQSKIILMVSFMLIGIGAFLVKIFDSRLTILEAIFEVVTARNSGFFTVDVNTLSEMNKFLMSILMFIGGGPGSNAGGIRISVFSILIFTMITSVRDLDEVVVSYKKINDKLIKKAVAIFIIDITIVFLGILGIALTDSNQVINIMFYVISTFTNTGLVTLDMETISFAGKCISIILMYFGRIAPITFLSLFTPIDNKKLGIRYPDIDLML